MSQILFNSGVALRLDPLLILTLTVTCFAQIPIKEMGT